MYRSDSLLDLSLQVANARNARGNPRQILEARERDVSIV
jgi:hypothetical protein